MKRRLCIYAFPFFLVAWTGHNSTAPVPFGPVELSEKTTVSDRAAAVQRTLSKQEQQELVDRHNYWRHPEKVDSLQWNSDLAVYAQNWADTLQIIGCNVLPRASNLYGENLKREPPRATPETAILPEHVVDEWAAELQWFDDASKKCRPDKKCDHYAQIVRADTRRVGCGRSVCDDNSQVWVCNYSPPGSSNG